MSYRKSQSKFVKPVRAMPRYGKVIATRGRMAMNLSDRPTAPKITIKQERIKIMKRRITIILTALGLLLSLGLLRLWLLASTTSGPLPALQGAAAITHLKERKLYDS